MASSVGPEKKDRDEVEEEPSGFLGKVKDFLHDIGEKIEDAVGFGKPEADVSGIRITRIDLERAEFVVDVLITNPNPIPIPLVDIDYRIESDGRSLLSGLIPDAGTIKPHGSETVQVALKLVYDDIRSTYDDVGPGATLPFKAKVDLVADVPILGRVTLPMEKEGEIRIPYRPEIDLRKVRFEEFSFEEANATLCLRLGNRNAFDLGVNSLEYEVCLGDVNVGGASLEKKAVIGKNGDGVLELPISFRPRDFGLALWNLISGKGTGYSMKGVVEVDTPFGPMKLPFNKEGGSTRLKKAEDNEDDDDDNDED